MKEDGVDEYDVRKQEEVLAETVMMIPERRTALESAVQDLTDLLVHPPKSAQLRAFLAMNSLPYGCVARRKRKKLSPSASVRRLLRPRVSSAVLRRS